MASAATVKWLDRLIWTLIFGGLLTLVVGLAIQRGDEATGWSFVVVGAVLVATGIPLIWLRSRLQVTRPTPSKGHP
jgi:undecaprenyl pyrophosphate phosphatase UppP